MPSNSSGTLIAVMPSSAALASRSGGIGGRVVGVVGGRAQDLLGELADRLDDHLLFVVGRQVEVVLAAGLEPGRSAAQVLDALELTAGGAGGGEERLDAVAQRPVERIAQVVLVQEFLADDGREQAQRHVDASPLVLVLADGGLPAGAFGRGVEPFGAVWCGRQCLSLSAASVVGAVR